MLQQGADLRSPPWSGGRAASRLHLPASQPAQCRCSPRLSTQQRRRSQQTTPPESSKPALLQRLRLETQQQQRPAPCPPQAAQMAQPLLRPHRRQVQPRHRRQVLSRQPRRLWPLSAWRVSAPPWSRLAALQPPLPPPPAQVQLSVSRTGELIVAHSHALTVCDPAIWTIDRSLSSHCCDGQAVIARSLKPEVLKPHT